MPAIKFIEDNLEKLRDKPWASKLGLVLSETGKLVSAAGNFVPGLGLVGGALSLGATLIDPPPSLQDIQTLKKSLETIAVDNSVVRAAITKSIEDMEERMNSQESEVRKDLGKVQSDMMKMLENVKTLNSEMSSEMEEIKGIAVQTFQLVVNLKYKDGLETLEAAFENFQTKTSFEEFSGFVYELETTARKYFGQSSIREYLSIVNTHSGRDTCKVVIHHVILVLGKYLQMMVAYHISKNDEKAVVEDFEYANNTLKHLLAVFEEVTKEVLILGDLPSLTDIDSKLQLLDQNKEVPAVTNEIATKTTTTTTAPTPEKNVETFTLDQDLLDLLERLELSDLTDIFAREELTIKDVVDMNDDELKSVGIPLFKQRKAIMRECQDLKEEKGKSSENSVISQLKSVGIPLFKQKKAIVRESQDSNKEKGKASESGAQS